MPFEIAAKKLEQTVSALHFANDGDPHEREYWPVLKERFPNCERFWQRLVVPMTTRIEHALGEPGRDRRREDIAEDAWTVSYLNYSLFLHMTAAYDHLPVPFNSSFGDFYSHLGSACDLAEDFLMGVYFIVSECEGRKIEVLQTLPRDEFLKLAGDWYDKHYAKLYEHYLKFGKGKPPIKLPGRASVIDEYRKRDDAWKRYQSFSQKIREYRNVIVHDVAMGNVLVGKVHMVPRKECIQDYRSLRAVQEAAQDVTRLKKGFILREEQMTNDMQELQQLFNALWEKPIADLTRLLYEERNPILLSKYNLHLTA